MRPILHLTFILICIYQVFGASSIFGSISFKVCNTAKDCGSGKCCVKPHPEYVMSRRAFSLLHPTKKTGHCLPHISLGMSCQPTSKVTGYSCPCKAGLHCNLQSALNILGKRSLFPKKYICEKHPPS